MPVAAKRKALTMRISKLAFVMFAVGFALICALEPVGAILNRQKYGHGQMKSVIVIGASDLRGTVSLNSTAITATAAELNIMDGVTATAGEINILDDATWRWSAQFPGIWAIDGDAQNGGLAGTLVAGDMVATEAAAAFCVVEDYAGTSDYQLLSTSALGAAVAANYQLFPDTEIENDAAYFGAPIPFCQLSFDISATVATFGADSIIWEYRKSDSTWATLTISYDHTDADDGDGDRPFQQDGAVTFVPPTDWATVEVFTQDAYWIRARCTASVDFTQVPLTDSKEHLICTPLDSATMPHDGIITGIRLIDYAATLHTTADVKFILMDFTTGAHSGELTFAQDKRMDSWSSLTMAASAGDLLGVLVTVEDGTNEAANVVLEIDATLN